MAELKLRPPKESRDEPPHSKAPASEGGRYTSEVKNGPKNRPEGRPLQMSTPRERRGVAQKSSEQSNPRAQVQTRYLGHPLREEELERIPVVGFPA